MCHSRNKGVQGRPKSMWVPQRALVHTVTLPSIPEEWKLCVDCTMWESKMLILVEGTCHWLLHVVKGCHAMINQATKQAQKWISFWQELTICIYHFNFLRTSALISLWKLHFWFLTYCQCWQLVLACGGTGPKIWHQYHREFWSIAGTEGLVWPRISTSLYCKRGSDPCSTYSSCISPIPSTSIEW